MRRALVLAFAVLLTLGGVARADSRLQANKAIAQRDARALLRQLRLPSSATPSSTQPPVAGLTPPRVSNENTVGVSAWWTASASPAAVLNYFTDHPPRMPGFTQVITEPPSLVIRSWIIDGAHLYSEDLEVTVATLANGRTGIMAQAQATWMVPRPLAEQLPAAVRSVEVTLRIGSAPGGTRDEHTRSYHLTGAATVTSIVSAFDAMPISQPGLFYGCPAMFPGMPRLRLRFLSGAGVTLARAQVDVYPGKRGDSGWINCDPIDFWIGAKRQIPLTSHTFVRQIAKLIDANIS